MVSLLWLVVAVQATEWVGADLGGGDLTVVDGDTMVGDFTGVGEFSVVSGATVWTTGDLSVQAQTISIEGAIVANGSGGLGGVDADGEGPGGGFRPASDQDAGGGGGGYGGAGADGGWNVNVPEQGLGGLAYGDEALLSPASGSGGGAGGSVYGVGGAGGGLVDLSASVSFWLAPTGRVNADGVRGGDGIDPDIGYSCWYGCGFYNGGGSGGGAGGSIRLLAPELLLEGRLTTRGGQGGDGGGYYSTGGGGGAGGRIAILGTRAGTPQVDVSGGRGGPNAIDFADSGEAGTWFEVATDACLDADLDGVCDTLDLCQGDDLSGDNDADGYCAYDILGAALDCDDLDANTFPGAPEVCDGLDNACVGRLPTEEADLDGDGVSICGGDCDDLDANDVCAQATGCATANTGPSSWWLLGLVLLLRRRSG